MRAWMTGLLVCLYGSISLGVKIWGPETPMGQGAVQAYVEASSTGEPLAIGIGFSRAALEGLPEHTSEFGVSLPSIISLPPYNHIVINWEPHGHEPEGIYNLPHFDFHFYLISPEARMKITCQGDDAAVCIAPPAPGKVPPFYVPTPAGVPYMGWHWVDPRSPEYNGQVFTATFIYGFYGGEMNFLEPMITRDFLLNTTHFETEIPTPEIVPKRGYYPDRYAAHFESCHQRHLVTLKNLTLRAGPELLEDKGQ